MIKCLTDGVDLIVIPTAGEGEQFRLRFCKPRCAFRKIDLTGLKWGGGDSHPRLLILVRLYSGQSPHLILQFVKQTDCGTGFFDQDLVGAILVGQFLDLGFERRVIG